VKLYDGLIGERYNSKTVLHLGSDDIDNLEKRLQEEDNDWYYRNIEIKYTFNEYGHRCKSPEEINLKNYILFVGCSHTVGVGLELEKTYPYLLSKKMNLDYYNLGVSGSGIDTLSHNLSIWINKFGHPNILIVQWPTIDRYACVNPPNLITKNRDMTVMAGGPWRSDKYHLDFLVKGGYIGYFDSVQLLTKLKIDSFNLPTVHIQPDYDGSGVPKEYLEFEILDKARDKHMGIISHKKVSENLYEKIKKLGSNI